VWNGHEKVRIKSVLFLLMFLLPCCSHSMHYVKDNNGTLYEKVCIENRVYYIGASKQPFIKYADNGRPAYCTRPDSKDDDNKDDGKAKRKKKKNADADN
jgi:hypothetical protein